MKILRVLFVGMLACVPPSLSATEAIDRYLESGDLHPDLVCEASLAVLIERFAQGYRKTEHDIYERIVAEVRAIDEQLRQIPGRPKGETPFERHVDAGHGFSFLRTDFLGRHLISIRRDADQFYWTIGVRYEGDFSRQKNDVRITGYQHVATNGNREDIEKALHATGHLFPTPER